MPRFNRDFWNTSETTISHQKKKTMAPPQHVTPMSSNQKKKKTSSGNFSLPDFRRKIVDALPKGEGRKLPERFGDGEKLSYVQSLKLVTAKIAQDLQEAQAELKQERASQVAKQDQG